MQPVTKCIGIACTALAATLTWSPLAIAQPSAQLDDLNSVWVTIPDEDRSDLVMLPALAAMDAPPPAASSIATAALLTPESDSWATVESWATAPAQVAVLDALKTVSERRSRFVFAQPYGDSVGNAAKDAGLWTDLGNPPLLANASFGWLESLDALGALVQVEATRLGDAGDFTGAMNLMTSWIRFARSFADRQFQEEISTALSWMIFGMERLRDLAYLYGDGIDGVELRAVIRELDERELNIARLRLPRGHRLAAEELLAMTFIERGGPNPDTFGRTFAQLETGDRPMRLFAEAARWQRLADQHADYFSTVDELEAVHSDWSLRWDVTPFDLIWNQAPHYERVSPQSHALITNVVPNAMVLFEQRRILRTELAGTRLALAIVGYEEWGGGWPDPVFAVRPRFISEIPIDPWNPAEDEPLKFFVPVRDLPSSERVQPGPHDMTVMGNMGDSIIVDASSEMPAPSEVLAWFTATQPSTAGNQRLTGRQLRMIAQSIPTQPNASAKSQIRAGVVQGLNANASSISSPLPTWVRTLAGASQADSRQPTEIAADAIVNITLAPSYREGLLELAGRPAVTAADMRQLMVNVAMGLLDGGSSAATTSVMSDSAYGVPSFTRTLDDSQFILYSVGVDGVAQRATQVGPGGNDLLIWPPLISLVREELSNN